MLSGILFGILYGFVCGRWGPVEVRRGPQRSDSRRLKSGDDHCDQALADDVRRRSLRSRAGRWSPARPTAIKSWQMRSGEEEGGRGGRRTRPRSRASDIKSNNPHLAGGEKHSLRGSTLIHLAGYSDWFWLWPNLLGNLAPKSRGSGPLETGIFSRSSNTW